MNNYLLPFGLDAISYAFIIGLIAWLCVMGIYCLVKSTLRLASSKNAYDTLRRRSLPRIYALLIFYSKSA